MLVFISPILMEHYRHDVLEGVGKLHLRLLLTDLVKSKYITLGYLNERLVTLDYGFVINKNCNTNSIQRIFRLRMIAHDVMYMAAMTKG